MRCADENCVHDHVFPRLREPKPAANGGYRALAPCHDDTQHSLSIGIGADGRPLWCCHACTSRIGKELAQIRTRQKLIEDGVPERCLPIPAVVARSLESQIREIVFGGGSRTHGWLRIAALLEGYDGLPAGHELEALAESCGVGMREAYKARSALQPTTGTGAEDRSLVKPRRSEAI